MSLYLHDGLSLFHPSPHAHTYNIFERIATTHYLYSPIVITTTDTAITADVLYAVPYPIAKSRTTDRIAINVAAGDAGKVARLGLYADTGSCYPGALIADSGEFSVADVELSISVLVQTVGPGLYWAVLLSNGVPTITRASDCLILLDRDAITPSLRGGVEKASSTYGALSGFDPFPATAGTSYKGTGILLRFSA